MSSQKYEALVAANRIRLERAKLHGELKQLSKEQAFGLVAAALEDVPDWLGSLEARVLLSWLPRMGVQSAEDILWRADASPTRRVRDLTPRQRRLIAEYLRRRQAPVADEAAA